MTTPQDALRDEIRYGLQDAAKRAAEAKLVRTAALAEIGHWLRVDRANGDLIGITQAEDLTGLSRPTLTEARRDESGWRELCELARMVRAYGNDYGHQDQLHARLPVLAGWYQAADLLWRRAYAEWQEQHGFDPMRLLDGPEPEDVPGYATLMEVYRAEINRLADQADASDTEEQA